MNGPWLLTIRNTVTIQFKLTICASEVIKRPSEQVGGENGAAQTTNWKQVWNKTHPAQVESPFMCSEEWRQHGVGAG